MSPAHVALVCLLALVPLAAADVCNATCELTPPCSGFSYALCLNANTSMAYNGSLCYSASNCASYTSTAGDLTVTLAGASPRIINPFYSVIQTAVIAAYNTYCTTGDNYKVCCPGAVSWTRDATKTAMSSTDEVQIPAATGTASQTVLIIRLTPSASSTLCSSVTYTSTTVTTSTTTTAAGTGTTTTMTAGTGTTTTTTAGTGTTTTMTAGTGTTTTTAAGTGTTTTMTAGTGTTTTTAAGTGTTTTMTAGTGTTTTTAAGTGTTTTTAAGTGTTTTMAAATGTTTAAAAPASTTTAVVFTTSHSANGTGTNGTVGRRRRDIDDPEEAMTDEAENAAPILQRNRRAVAVPIVLPANTIATIASSISITSVISNILANNSIIVTVTVTTVGSTSSNLACHLESSHLLIYTTALMALLAFSLRRNT